MPVTALDQRCALIVVDLHRQPRADPAAERRVHAVEAEATRRRIRRELVGLDRSAAARPVDPGHPRVV